MMMVHSEYYHLVATVRAKKDNADSEMVTQFIRLAAVALKAAADLGRPEHRREVKVISDRMAAQGKGYAVAPKGLSKAVKGKKRPASELARVREMTLNWHGKGPPPAPGGAVPGRNGLFWPPAPRR